ncbi:hypothetical protein RBSH_05393 [Rhodopirellula baltica SH28]|uniref:Uncharacterized protein n=1 Tax=Rhodopirellula baltica SH28 TaxID=993517 RepID=K5C8K1_RHOBT|nr:hypothetical protein RBSH_05393 [Rhodopirellula baltica SH28]
MVVTLLLRPPHEFFQMEEVAQFLLRFFGRCGPLRKRMVPPRSGTCSLIEADVVVTRCWWIGRIRRIVC